MILITGSNGYVGTHLVERLCGEGMAVRALVRRGCSADEQALLKKMGAEVCEADLEDDAVILRAMEGVHTVVHLLGSIERPERGGYRGMHTLKTSLLLKAFKAALSGAEKRAAAATSRIIYLSAIGAAKDAGNQYARTKWEAEDEIGRSGLDYVIVRSSLIFGRETGTRDSKIVRKLMRVSAERKAVPLVRAGRNRLQPIYVGDLVSCIAHAIAVPAGCHDIWEVGGPDVLTLREITERLIKMRGLRRRIAGIPYPVAFIAGLVARLLRREGTLNLEQIRMSRCDTICTRNKAESLLGDRLTGFDAGMAKTIARFGLVGMPEGKNK